MKRISVFAAAMVSTAALAGAALAAGQPSATTGDTSSVNETSAVLHGSVNPNGSPTTYQFQWGQTTNYGTNGPMMSAGSGTKATQVHESADGLQPGTTYHYRLVATNPAGTTTGSDRTFTTPGRPGASTGPATGLSSSGATLTGTVTTNGATTIWFFAWGNSKNFRNRTPQQTLAPSSSPQSVSWSLQGLDPASVHKYRLVVRHPNANDVNGNTELFMTYPSVRPFAGIHAFTFPRHRIRYPFTFVTTGTISHPSFIPARFACIGTVHIRVYTGRQQRRFEIVPVQPNCTFSATTIFYKLPFGTRAPVRLQLFARFQSTGYLANWYAAHDRMTIR